MLHGVLRIYNTTENAVYLQYVTQETVPGAQTQQKIKVINIYILWCINTAAGPVSDSRTGEEPAGTGAGQYCGRRLVWAVLPATDVPGDGCGQSGC